MAVEYDDDPINNSPGDWRACSECRGKGGHLLCPECSPGAFED